MSNSASPEDGEPLSAADLELLGRARAQRERERVPADVRERLFARVLEVTTRADPHLVVPAAQFVTVPPRSPGVALRWGAALAFGIVLLTQVRGWLRDGGQSASDGALLGGEPSANGSGSASTGFASGAGLANGAAAGAQKMGLHGFDSRLFHAPASAFADALPAPEASLFAEPPFSARSRAWQVRRWDDLGAAPVEPAKYHIVGAALCVELGNGERVIGGWPWLPAGEVTAAKPVQLEAGKSYRLVFKAWAQDPLPAQVLIAVGHDRMPFSAAAGARVEVSNTPQAFAVSFVAVHDDPSIGVAFLGSAAEGAERSRLCWSDVTLTEERR